MPRIIDVDTEAFAPTYRSTYQPPREDPREAELRRMGAKMQLAGQALPFISEGIKGLDEYLVTPIQKALKEGREEEYKAKKAGQALYEPGETAMQKIARERMAEKEKQKPFDTSAWEKEELDREAMEKDLFGKGDVWRLEAQKPSYVGGEETAKMFGEERPEFGELEVPLGKTDEPDTSTLALIAKQREEQQVAQKLKEQEPPTQPTVIARDPVTGELRAVPGQPSAGIGRGSLAYEMEVSRQRSGLPPRKPVAATAPTEAAPAGVVQIGHPAVTGVKVPSPRKPAESEFAGVEAPAEPTQTAQMAKAAAAPAAPAKPKTLADVTDDELSDVKRRLEKLVKQNPADKELADRLESVNLEQRHRGEKMEYEDWAAEARRATTPEEQARVLEMASRVRMPVEGLEGLLRSPFERAKLKALGTPGEKGLFPETSRTSEEQRFLYMQKAIKQQLENEGVDPLTASKIAKNQAQAEMYGSRTQETEAMLPYKMAYMGEGAQLRHAQEERMKQMGDIADQKLPNEIALMKARTAKLMADARRPRGAGGAGRSKDDLAKMIQILKAEDQKNIGNVANMYGEASRNHQTILAQALNDERDARVAKGNYDDMLQAGAGLSPSKKAAYDLNVAKLKREADAAEEKAKLSRAQANASQTSLEQIDAQRAKALETARQNSAQVDALLEKYTERRGVPYLPREVKPVAPPARKPGTDGASPAAAAAPAPAAVTHKEGDEAKDTKGNRIVWHDGRWTYP